MSRRRRAVLLFGLALVLGGLAASDVSRREHALRRQLGPDVPVVVARRDLSPGDRLDAGALALRRVPARFVPAGTLSSPASLAGQRLAAAVSAGGYVAEGDVGTPGGSSAGSDGAAGPNLRTGERAADVVAAGPSDQIVPGSRVDVLVTREGDHGNPGSTALALEDVEVLAATPAQADTSSSSADSADQPRVAASLRVTLRQAVYLAAAQSFARELRLLPRAPGDRSRGDQGLRVDGSLG
jgi:pilus assembly protein CpaB